LFNKYYLIDKIISFTTTIEWRNTVNDDLNDMMVFLAVVETGSFTLAADRLGIPKANVSRKVSKLEHRLKVTLLERSTRSQHLTEAGSEYLKHCKRIHEEIDLANAAISEITESYKGKLKVGASVATGQQILKPCLANFMHQYPDINIQLNLVNRRVDFIEEGFDVVIRIGHLEDSMLVAKKLGTISRRIFASHNYLKHQNEPIHPEQLCDHKILVMNALNNDTRLPLQTKNNKSFTVDCTPRLLVDDFTILKQAILDGIGIGVLPEYMVKKEISSGEITQILPDWGMEDVDVYALYPRNRSKIPKVKAFIDFATEVYLKALNPNFD